MFLKALFSYDPRRDNLVPCRDAALGFKEGDILQVVNREDPNWWQVRGEALGFCKKYTCVFRKKVKRGEWHVCHQVSLSPE